MRNIQSSRVQGKDELRLLLHYERLAQAGLTALDVSVTVRSAFDGEIVTSIRKGNETIDYRLRLKDRKKFKARDILNLVIPNQQGALIPLKNFARFQESPSAAVIRHSDGQRSVTVLADVDNQITTPGEVNAKLLKFIEPQAGQYPGINIELGGEEKETIKSFYNFFLAFMVALIAIYFLLVLLFDSFWLPFMVLTAVPSAMVGVFPYIYNPQYASGFHGLNWSTWVTGNSSERHNCYGQSYE